MASAWARRRGLFACANAIHAGVREAAITRMSITAAHSGDAERRGLRTEFAAAAQQHRDAVAKLRTAIGDAGSQQRAAARGAQLEQAGQTGRIGPGGAGGSHHPIVAGQFALAIDLPQHPRGHRMQRENGPGDPRQQVGPIVAPRDVRQFVQQDVIEFARQ